MTRTAKARPRRQKSDKTELAFGDRRHLPAAAAWTVIFAFAGLAAISVMVAVRQPAMERGADPISGQALCQRGCDSDLERCLAASGSYQRAIVTCRDYHEKCQSECAPAETATAAPMTLQSCVKDRCRPPMDSCLAAAESDSQRSSCENGLLDCLTECRFATGTDVPLPAAPLPTVTQVMDRRRVKAEQIAFGQAKQAIMQKASALPPIQDRIDDLRAQGIDVPEDLAQAMEAAQTAARQAAGSADRKELESLAAADLIETAVSLAEDHEPLLADLSRLPAAWPLLEKEISDLTDTLAADQGSVAATDGELDQAIGDMGQLLDTARISLATSKKLVGSGRPEEGLGQLNAGVLDNLKEIRAIHQAINWTVDQTAVLQGSLLVSSFEGRLSAGSATAEAANIHLTVAKSRLRQLETAEAEENYGLVFLLSKEIIDILEMAEALAAGADGTAASPLQEYLNG